MGIFDPTIVDDESFFVNFEKFNLLLNSKLESIEDNLDKSYYQKNSEKIGATENQSKNSPKLEIVTEVENLANQSKDISILEKNIINFKKFHSLRGSNKLLLGKGNPNSRLLVISEPPNYQEELEQLPYVGDSQILFDKIIESMGLFTLNKNNCNIFVLPAIPFRLVKTGNEKISDLELMKPFLRRYIKIISPDYLIFVSKIPANVLGLTDFSKFNDINGFIGNYLGIPTIEIEGIKSMIDNPEKKRKTWNNIKLILQLMKKENE